MWMSRKEGRRRRKGGEIRYNGFPGLLRTAPSDTTSHACQPLTPPSLPAVESGLPTSDPLPPSQRSSHTEGDCGRGKGAAQQGRSPTRLPHLRETCHPTPQPFPPTHLPESQPAQLPANASQSETPRHPGVLLSDHDSISSYASQACAQPDASATF